MPYQPDGSWISSTGKKITDPGLTESDRVEFARESSAQGVINRTQAGQPVDDRTNAINKLVPHPWGWLNDASSAVGGALGQAGDWLKGAYNDLTGQYQVGSQAFAPQNNGIDPETGLYRKQSTAFGDQAQGYAGQGDQSRGQQQQLIQMLMDSAQGQGPSVAENQLKQATDRNVNSAMAMAASGRGPGAAAGAYNAANMGAQANQQSAMDSAILRSNEQNQARAMLGGVLSGMRGQDVSQQQFFSKLGTDTGQNDRDALIKEEQLRLQAFLASQGAKNDLLGMGARGLGGLFGAMSDENVKEDIEPAGGSLYAFLDKLDAHSYKYKDEKHGKGRRISPMAQELEQSDLGKEFVFETEDGKAVDYGKGFGTMLAAQAELHKRLKRLEQDDE